MNTLSFDRNRCDGYVSSLILSSNELLVELPVRCASPGELQACSGDWSRVCAFGCTAARCFRTGPVPDSVRTHVVRNLRASQTRSFAGVSVKRWLFGLATAALVLFGLFARNGLNLRRGEQLIASILKLG